MSLEYLWLHLFNKWRKLQSGVLCLPTGVSILKMRFWPKVFFLQMVAKPAYKWSRKTWNPRFWTGSVIYELLPVHLHLAKCLISFFQTCSIATINHPCGSSRAKEWAGYKNCMSSSRFFIRIMPRKKIYIYSSNFINSKECQESGEIWWDFAWIWR